MGSMDNGPHVALRKESVDRNTDTISDYLRANRSLSARRAWIEIVSNDTEIKQFSGSLSARRAWIEMYNIL